MSAICSTKGTYYVETEPYLILA